MRTMYLSIAALCMFAKANEGGGEAVPPAPKAPVPAAGTVTGTSTAFALPEKKNNRGGGPSKYKFDDLAAPTIGKDGKPVHDSFGVVGKTKDNMASNVFNANKQNRTYLKNEDGSPKLIKGRKGALVQEYTQNKLFEAFDVPDTGDGVTVRVFRVK